MTDTHAVTRRIDMPAAGRYTLDPVRSSLTLRTRLFGLESLTEIDSVQVTGQGFRAHATTRIDRAAFGLTTAQWMGGRIFDIELTAAADPL